MEIKTLLKANLKSHRGTVLGVFVLILLVSLCLFRNPQDGRFHASILDLR